MTKIKHPKPHYKHWAKADGLKSFDRKITESLELLNQELNMPIHL